MSVNARRGEIEAELDGEPRRLCLTLGALAELEHAFGADNLVELTARFSSGRLSALDLTRIIGAGLRGAGSDISDEQVATMRTEGGVAGFADIAARLLAATFSQSTIAPATSPQGGAAPNP